MRNITPYRAYTWDHAMVEQTSALRRAADMARMATDTMEGLNKIGYILKQYRVGLITEREAMERL